MKLIRFGIRFWITITSVISFVTGWILLAHAPKPASAASSNSNNVTTIATLEPLRPLPDFQTGDDDSQTAPSFQFQPQNQVRPRFRTGGS